MYKFAMLLIVLTWGLAACSAQGGLAAASASLTTSVPAVDETGTPVAEDVAAREGDVLSGVVACAIVPEESTVTYEVGETFIDHGNVFAVAVGQTQGVTGEIRLNFDQPQDTTVGALTVDISGFTSDNQRRDSAIRDRFLQSAQYPTVTFTPTEIDGLPEAIEPGVDYAITLRGDLAIRDTTRPVVFDAQVRLDGDTLTGQAITTFLMSEYGFGPIDILGILKTEDEVKITVDFVARP
jgi:polyisoprenoid-binding protein YceI